MARSIKTEAIIFKKRSLPNEDRIITIFSRDLGKIRTIAKGIKKITSRRLPHAETGNLIKITLHQSRDYFYFSDSQLISGFTSIKADTAKMEILYYFFFILERLLPENQPERHVYNRTLQLLIELSEDKVVKKFPVLRYMNDFYMDLGYSEKEMAFEPLQRAIEETIHQKLPELHI